MKTAILNGECVLGMRGVLYLLYVYYTGFCFCGSKYLASKKAVKREQRAETLYISTRVLVMFVRF
jgi:hypothetical protein